MADSESTSQEQESQALTPARIKRLQKMFEHGLKQVEQGAYDYALELLTECVVGNPGNLEYSQTFLTALQKKYNNNRKGAPLAQFKERGARGAIKKAIAAEDWNELIKNALKVFRINPWDVTTLLAFATAMKGLGHSDPELYFLKTALESDSKNVEVNIRCAAALRKRRQFDQALACLHRAQKEKPNDEEIQKQISAVAVEKTIVQGGITEDNIGDGGHTRTVQTSPAATTEEVSTTPEEHVRRKIKNDPKNMVHYLELADMLLKIERYDKAGEILQQGIEACGQETELIEKLEDVQLRQLRQKISEAEETGDQEERKQLRKEMIQRELEVYEGRCERYPTNLVYRFELALRYRMSGQYEEAIKHFQMARNDPRRKGLCLLELGRCFQQIKQYRLALNHYQQATKEVPEREEKAKKESFYLLGRLAMALRQYDLADQALAKLAEIDFSFKDVAELLEKVAELRKSAEEGTEPSAEA